MYTVYILLCGDGSLYTGITNDLPRRLEMHKKGVASRYTRSRGVVKVVYTERKRTKGNALKREYAIKQLSREEKEQLYI
jgi:putative endonuclease